MEASRAMALARFAGQIDVRLHVGQQLEQRAPDGDSVPVSRRPAAASNENTPYGFRGGEHLTDEGIAVIEVSGVLMKFVGSLDDGTSTVRLREKVRRAARSSNVRGIMLVIDSPGGTVAGTESLASDIARAARSKPVHAYFEDLTASAALWIGVQANVTSANATALVGSIGTYLLVYDLHKLAENEGIEPVLIRAGEPYKGAGAPGTEITQVQRAKWQQDINALNEHFLRGVARGRNLPIERVRELNTGEVWIGQAARTAGLVDHIESIDGAMSRLRQVINQSSSQQSRSLAMFTNPALGEAFEEETADAEDASPAADAIAADIVQGIRRLGLPRSLAGAGLTLAPNTAPTAPASASPIDTVQQQETVMSKDAKPQSSTAAPDSETTADTDTSAPNADAKPQGEKKQDPAASEKPAPQGDPTSANAGPATLAELKTAFPDDAAFVLSALENGETLAQAKGRHKEIRLAKLEEENRQLKAQLESGKSKQETTEKPKQGVPPVPDRNAAENASRGDLDARAEADKLISETMQQRNLDRRTAACRVFKQRPDLAEALRHGSAA